MAKPRVAVHKFSSCDGCQLAFLNLSEDLLRLTQNVELVHFLEAGLDDATAQVDVAFVEGSISTPEDLERIQTIRANSKLLITIGACATSGGVQALRNYADAKAWTQAIYASPQYISSLDKVSPIAAQVKVDFELWGCPITGRQVIDTVRALINGALPVQRADKVCSECKRHQYHCVLVSQGLPCMGPVTRSGCGALCPSIGRECYGCFGPAENTEAKAFAEALMKQGLPQDVVQRRFKLIHSLAKEYESI